MYPRWISQLRALFPSCERQRAQPNWRQNQNLWEVERPEGSHILTQCMINGHPEHQQSAQESCLEYCVEHSNKHRVHQEHQRKERILD